MLATNPRKTVITPSHKTNGWFKINYNEKTGWVSEEYFLEYLELKRYQTMESVALRSSPSSSSKKILTITKSKMTGNPDVDKLHLALMSYRVNKVVSYQELDFSADGRAISVYF